MVSKVLVTAVLVALAAHLFSSQGLISVKQSGLFSVIMDGGWGTLGAGFVVAVLLHRNLWGYTPRYDDSKDRKRTLKRRAAQYPAPYPNGWYKVADSKDVGIGKVKQVHALGTLMVIFRGHDGKAAVLDGYCPHLGANLAVGGTVIGNCIQCPFHKWTFATDGTCTKIPYVDKVPDFAKTQSWPVQENNNMIFVFYDCDKKQPSYRVPLLKEIENKEFVYRGRRDMIMEMHLQEFAENSADFQHFDPLHGRMCIPFTTIVIPGVKIIHKADWHPEKDSQVATFEDEAYLSFMGKRLPRTDAKATITFIGPGGVVVFRFITEIGQVLMVHTHLPLGPTKQKVEMVWYAEPKMPSLIASYIVGSWISQVKNDQPIWENKTHLPNPMLLKEDGPIMPLRRWFSQFYSNTSRKQTYSLDW